MTTPDKLVRVRFAPSPTGSLHIGNLRTALYNRLFANRHQGTFYIRIEDTDRTRFVPGGTEELLRVLGILGIAHDEGPFLVNGKIKERGKYGPYIQSARLAIYQKHAAELAERGAAYYCLCTSEELEASRQNAMSRGEPIIYDRRCRRLSDAERKKKISADVPRVIRLAVPESGQTSFNDTIRGTITFSNRELDDAILLKSDGYPTYHLASVIDDHLMETTHVIRGEEWISSTPKHILLYEAFGWTPPEFAHLPLLLNPDRSKLSKRQADAAVEDYLGRGYLPEALINFVALLGSNPSADREIYSLDELSRLFDLRKINSTGAAVNTEKLNWLNRHYLRLASPKEFLQLSLPYLNTAGLLVAGKKAGEWVGADGRRWRDTELQNMLKLEKERVSALSEVPEAVAYFFKPVKPEAKLLCWKKFSSKETRERLTALNNFLARQKVFSDAVLESATKDWIRAQGWGNGEVLWPMRVALTGREASPSPFEVAAVLDKDATIDRINHAIQLLSE
ncbi:glutamate--tRNA ligase [Patescibacteria group bacterium]|nr:MAG: glutamate--tRNA ligase [Patescibacteria group bacterium]